jgi:hypothetical protein
METIISSTGLLITRPGLFGGIRSIMKLAQSPKAFTFVLISFTFLIVQFGLVNKYLSHPTQSQLPAPKSTQFIPETYLPVVVGAAPGWETADTGALTPTELASEIQVEPSEATVTTFSTGALLEDASLAESYADPYALAAHPENDQVESATSSPGEALGGGEGITEVSNDPEFESFRQEVTNGDFDTVTGIYVAGIFSLRVLQQPPEDVSFVSNEEDTATQFQSPAYYGVIGLLAHNFLSGKHFFSLQPGHEIRIVFGSGSFRKYQITGIADFERLTRFDIRSDFRDLQTNALMGSTDLFSRFYQEGNYLTLQTCLEREGYSNWGVRMISAVPIDHEG